MKNKVCHQARFDNSFKLMLSYLWVFRLSDVKQCTPIPVRRYPYFFRVTRYLVSEKESTGMQNHPELGIAAETEHRITDSNTNWTIGWISTYNQFLIQPNKSHCSECAHRNNELFYAITVLLGGRNSVIWTTNGWLIRRSEKAFNNQ